MGIIPRRPVRGSFRETRTRSESGSVQALSAGGFTRADGTYFDSTASRSHSPDRPPLFINNRTGPIVTPRSRLLTMS